ncbi:tRNA wybutosine-synthesizing protein 2 [Mortierella claussenii]|nr:tRNA wybutosine-synthesizing protein 2 [Mortierella claussenii]
MASITGSTIPVLLAPASLTRHLKVLLDTAGWRDSTKLITRYSQVQQHQLQQADQASSPSPTELVQGQEEEYDLASYMAIALLSSLQNLSMEHHFTDGARIPLSRLLQNSASPLSQIQWPSTLSDPSTQKTIFLTWLNPSSFPTPKHVLAQTPLERLRKSIAGFLTPYLHAWESSSTSSSISSSTSGPTNYPLSMSDLPALIASIPQKWEHYSDFTLLPSSAFVTPLWISVLEHLQALDITEDHHRGTEGVMARWDQLIQSSLQSTNIARKAIIPVQDVLRRPQIRPLTGDWKLHNQYKTWTDIKDQKLLKHQDMNVADSLSKIQGSNSNSNSAATPASSHDITAPTEDNFLATYWAETCQNHVHYVWSPMFTMFSAGNITEKERVAQSRPIFDSQDKVVVDLYAGIGYFTLVYLVHAGAKVVHACEWNPWSVEGLVRGANRNGISWKAYRGPALLKQEQQLYDQKIIPSSVMRRSADRTKKKAAKDHGQLVIYPGDNAQWIHFFENQAHHVNLGLIPSAEPGWVLGVRALCPKEGGYLHVHHNIRVGEEQVFASYLLKTLDALFAAWKPDGRSWSLQIRHIENVKSFAPMVFHYVLDVECRPPPLS